jgi:hypothetical protein
MCSGSAYNPAVGVGYMKLQIIGGGWASWTDLYYAPAYVNAINTHFTLPTIMIPVGLAAGYSYQVRWIPHSAMTVDSAGDWATIIAWKLT